ncbi:MAG: polysaccharide biosynthesis protein [Bacteroidales bacterium]|jgi:FlaA1/EpsC-like NDP-sugar epimerase|nr:polysaccharide biosynthesis protein [Bacteroidales bacterium]
MESNQVERLLMSLAERIRSVKYLNEWIIFIIDTLISVVSITIVYYFSLKIFEQEYQLYNTYTYWNLCLLTLCSSIIFFGLFKTSKGIVRFTALHDIWRIVGAVSCRSLVIFCILFMQEANRYEILLIECLLDLFLCMFLMIAFRTFLVIIYQQLTQNAGKIREKILVYGIEPKSVSIGALLTSAVFDEYLLMGFISPDPSMKNARISGFDVFSLEGIEDVLEDLAINAIIFPTRNLVKKSQTDLVQICLNNKIKMLVTPSIEELGAGKVSRSKIKEIQIEDLLDREEIQINLKEIGLMINGKTILISGAAGSIGSELVRQLARFRVNKLILFDMAESPLHDMSLELQDKFPYLSFVCVIGDVRSPYRVDYVFRNHHPEIVFHAAAYKHVPLMEMNPCEAVMVNVQGTRNMVDFSVKYKVEKFVMISTDKAVNPTNIMGASKRIAEMYAQCLDKAIQDRVVEGITRFATTRFGNVLGSNGSVIPRFRSQISAGGPLTVTHPEIIRYFMTIPEACRLVLEAAFIGHGGEIFVFDMGDPVKIADLAKRMIELAGFEPDIDIPIVYTGLRPGEKLYEELLNNEEHSIPTSHKKIMIAKVREYEYREIINKLNMLIQKAQAVDIVSTVKMMKEIVPEFISQNSVFEKYDVNN